MDNLESKILEILKRGSPLRAANIAAMLGVERREVNHYLYSSLNQLVVQDSDYRWSLKTNQIDNLEFKILEILKRGIPLRAANIAAMLGVERREVNHYLYSSLNQLVVQDSDYRWSLKTNQIGHNQRIPTQPLKPHIQSPTPLCQNTLYRFTKTAIKWLEQEQTDMKASSLGYVIEPMAREKHPKNE